MKQITKIYKIFLFNLKRKIDLDNQLKKESLNELFNYFGTDKGTNVINPYSQESNEILGHGFAKFYEKKLKKIKYEKFEILEIGAWEGASTAAFMNYFPNSKIYCIDKSFRFKFRSKRVFFNYCDINDSRDLKKISTKFYKKKFKIIIDDASHILTDMIRSLKFFFNYLENGGIFIIEDFNAPLYFNSLNDSNCKEIMMEDLLKNLKRKKKFKSNILSDMDQENFFNNISEIEIFKGKTQISDIAFLKKK